MALSSILESDSALSIHKRIKIDRDKDCLEQGIDWNELVTFRSYAKGKHAVVLTEKQKEILRNLLSNNFCDNVCHEIIAQAVGRLTFVKYECKDEGVKKWLDSWFALARLQERQGDVHYRTLRDGNFAALIQWNNKKKRVELVKENWWNGINGVFIKYSENDEIEYAVKEWQERPDGTTTIYRRLIWFEDRIERYLSTTNGDESWIMVNLSTEIDTLGNPIGSIPWRDKEGVPIGVPYIPFINSNKSEENYGTSELSGGVIGFQDQINDAHYGLSQTGRMTGGQMYYATGVKLKKKDGSKDEYLPPKTEPGAWHTSENENSTFGTLSAGDIDKQIKLLEIKLKRVASMTQTPMHFITGGDWPAAEALLRAEQPAINKAHRQINRMKSSWVDCAIMALKIHNKFSQEKVSFDVAKGIIEAVFEDPENRDIVSRSIVVHNAGPNISKREGLRIMGYSEEKAQAVYDEIIEEERESAEMVAQSIARGNPPTQKRAAGDRTDTNKS